MTTCTYCDRIATISVGRNRDRDRPRCGEQDCRRAHNAWRQREFRARYESRTGKPYRFNRDSDRVHRESASRRATARGVRVGPSFTRKQIGDRDGWQCWLCKKPIDQALKWPDPMSQSLEHKTPLVLDGEHSAENCTVAHLSCNSSDGTKWRLVKQESQSQPS